MIEQFILLIILLLLSGFFEGTELAFIVANKLKIEVKARKKQLTARNALYFINHPETFSIISLSFLSTIPASTLFN